MTDYSIEIDEQGSLFFPSIELKHSGVYKLVASNECGEAEKVVTVSVMSEGCDGGEEINQPVPVAEFGAFVSEHHARGNKKFRESYEVKMCKFHHFCIFIIVKYRGYPLEKQVMRSSYQPLLRINSETDSRTSVFVSCTTFSNRLYQ